MLTALPFAFLNPWFLLGLGVLPFLWRLLRIMPPGPQRIPFPALRLLIGLHSEEKTPATAPWWLVVLRLLIAALIILACAGPVINPDRGQAGSGPQILIVEDDFAAARNWDRLRAHMLMLVDRAERANRPVMLITTAAQDDGDEPEPLGPTGAQLIRERLQVLQPKPWPGDRQAIPDALEGAEFSGTASIAWAANGLAMPDAGTAEAGAGAIFLRLQRLGRVTLLEADPAQAPVILTPGPDAGTAGEGISIRLHRPASAEPLPLAVALRAADGRTLAMRDAVIPAGAGYADIRFSLPGPLRNEAAMVTLENRPGAGGVLLLDGRWRRPPIGIVVDGGLDAGRILLSETYYLDRALAGLGSVSQAPLELLLKTPQQALFLPDATPLDADSRARLTRWVEGGGVLVRFAGPRLARGDGRTDGIAGDGMDPLLPMALRRGGRSLSGAMQWSTPAAIGSAADHGPFAGLSIPDDVAVKSQVLAEPGPDLRERIWLRLADDTPLVTGARRGEGRIVLIHTTANTDWSTLALSGFFVDMLERLIGLGRGSGVVPDDTTPLYPQQTLDGFGILGPPSDRARGLLPMAFADAVPGPRHPPGFYGDGVARRALNLGPLWADGTRPMAAPPSGVARAGYGESGEYPLRGIVLAVALLLILLDTLIGLGLRGLLPDLRRRRRRRQRHASGGKEETTTAPRPAVTPGILPLLAAVGLSCNLILGHAAPAPAQGTDSMAQTVRDAFARSASNATTLAYVITGDGETDAASLAGLRGLTMVLRGRTAIEAAEPVGVDIERDELAFFPLLYWPVGATQPTPGPEAVERLNRYISHGGTLLFDTRDGYLGPVGDGINRDLARLTYGLELPPLEAATPDHVLTKSFYLMQNFPGRWDGGNLWVEAADEAVNDGVSRIIVGNADWAGAWAVDDFGSPLYPVVPGGARQREFAYRFGVNLVMHSLTGNYKLDQVHVPAILERLGQ